MVSSNLYVVRELAMYYLLVAAPSSVTLSSGSPLESRQSDPCARIVNQAWSNPSEVNSCLSSFPFNTTLRDNVADILSKTFSQFHTSTNFHLNMPDPFTEVTIDLLGELRRIKTTTYISDFAFHRDISTTFKRLGDSHAGYVNYCYDSLYSTYLPSPLAVLACPGAQDIQNIHIVPEASEVVANEFGDEAVEIWQAALGGRNLTEFNGAQIVSINGRDPWAIVDTYAATAGGFQAKTTRQNGFFASYELWNYNMGGFAQLTLALPPPNDTVSLTLIRNGTTSPETYNVPYLSRLGSKTVEFTDAQTLWSNNCLPTGATNGDLPSDASQALRMKTVAGLQSTGEEDPLSQPAKFQKSPIVPPVVDGRRESYASLVYDEPQDISLPEHLSPTGSVTGYAAVNWHMLDDGETAILWLASFDGRYLELQNAILNGLNAVKAKGAQRLLIDVTNNGGGQICFASFLHRVVCPLYAFCFIFTDLWLSQFAGPQPGLDVQPGLDGSIRAQDLPQKMVAKIIVGGVSEDGKFHYNPLNYKGTNGADFAANFNWLDPPIQMQVNGVTDKFSQKMGDFCLPFPQLPPATQPFAFENITIMGNGRCASACSLFSILMRTKYNVKTVVVGGKPGTTQQYCGVVGGQSLSFVPINADLKLLGLKNDTLAPPDFLTNSYQGLTWKLAYSPSDPTSFEEFKSHPAQFVFPLLPSIVNNPRAIWEDVSKRLWLN
ncbi:peptidase family s41 domain protein [Rhizoctonia solani 123E]|uniref:Peptidase family s41 domain protein n=1 Tax=Rhizoctonia solani 123E TaxID=1423351 RepID=A0A074RDN5_9AGAM|nr:peptidase family s41 domain protein [Rhizoctonia solani 123E]